MKFSYKWIKELTEITTSPEELAQDLSCKSVEVEGITPFGGDFLEKVVVGEIIELEKHPNADKLQVTKVNIGSAISENSQNSNNSHLLQIVCGAPNIAVGQKVPVALVGCKLPSSEGLFEIKEAKIRDVESYGMLCAEDEIGLGSDHSGILILDSGLEIGTKLSDIYNDFILDIGIGANRGDLQSHIALAREVAAIYGKRFDADDVFIKDEEATEASDMVEVSNENTKNCPIYNARVIKGIKIGPSPIWMQQKLLACGMRPINNIVDITNYVMIEYGNPLHAFDARKITKVGEKHKIIVRETEKDEKIRTLDGEDHVLPEGVLVIADTKGPIAVAGIMGGENSEIDPDTTDVILESASFASPIIRKGQRKMGFSTEASIRFAKGIPPYISLLALDRAAKLMEELAGGEIVAGKVSSGKQDFDSKKIISNIKKIKDYLGIDIADRDILIILKSLGIESAIEGAVLFSTVSPDRLDINIWQDIAEEIGRIYGFDKVIEADVPTEISPKTEKILYFEQAAKKYLCALGMTEVFNYSIIPESLLNKTLVKERFFEIRNPLTEDDRVLRPSLVPGLLANASFNAKKFDSFALFEVSKVYLPSTFEKISSVEERKIGLLVYGEKDDDGIFVLRKYIEEFGAYFELPFHFEDAEDKARAKNHTAHPGRFGEIFIDQEKVGEIYEIHPMVLDKMDIPKRVWVAEISLELLNEHAENIKEVFSESESEAVFKEYSRFEVSKRDVALIVDKAIDAEEMAKAIMNIDERVVGAELFDEYISDKLGEGKKSLAFHVTFQSTDHTLTEQEVGTIFESVVKGLEQKFSAKIRS